MVRSSVRRRSTGSVGRDKRKTRSILCIPGLGGDARIFEPIIGHWKPEIATRLKFARLTPASPGESLEQYAERILKDQGLHSEIYALVVGISFGGMIAQAALRSGSIRANGAVLISTALSGDDLTVLTRLLAFLLPMIPRFAHGPIVHFLAFLYPKVRQMKEARIFAAMLKEQPPDMLFRIPSLIRAWRPESPALPCSFLHIQGTRDPLISFKSIQRKRAVDIPIPGGNHLIFVSEAATIARLF